MPDEPSPNAEQRRSAAPWRVKYDGVCSRCGNPLRAGEVAVYERPTRSIRCTSCPTAEAGADEPDFDAGVAGGSARREYERRKENRESRVKDRFGQRFGGVVLALTDDPQSTRAWATGARGEEKFAAALDGIDGLRVLHDRRVPKSRANIDHIVVAPAGIFVVDAKHYRGTIAIRNRGWLLRPDHRLYVGRRDCSALATGMGWQVESVAVALTAAGVDPLPPVTPVLCFINGEWPLFSAPDEFAGVRIEGTRSIRKLMAAPTVLDGPSIERLARILAASLPAK